LFVSGVVGITATWMALKTALNRLIGIETYFTERPAGRGREECPGLTKNGLNSCNRVRARDIFSCAGQSALGQASCARVRTTTIETAIRGNLARLDSSKMNLVLAVTADEI
jgi:uncharacterized membrane protein